MIFMAINYLFFSFNRVRLFMLGKSCFNFSLLFTIIRWRRNLVVIRIHISNKGR